jgi:hypothetical protein
VRELGVTELGGVMAIEFRRDGPWTLPEGWVWARLGDIATILPGQSPPSHTYNAHGEGLPFFQGKSEFGESSPTARKWCSLPRRIAEPGDILISVRAPVGPTNLANLQVQLDVVWQPFGREAVLNLAGCCLYLNALNTRLLSGRMGRHLEVFPLPCSAI